MDSTTIKRAKPAKKKLWIPVNSVILMSLGYFYLFISTRIYENRVSHLPCLSLFTVLFAYVASFIIVSWLGICVVFRADFAFFLTPSPSLPPSLPPSLAKGCFSFPIRNLLSWTKVAVIWNQKPKAGFGADPQFKRRYWSPWENFPGEHHVKLWGVTKLIRFAVFI